MKDQLDQAHEVLRRTPSLLNVLFEASIQRYRRGNRETWGVDDVIRHLVNGERFDWIPRVRIILEHGESRCFDPFDRFAQFQSSQRSSTIRLVRIFAEARCASLETLGRLDIRGEQWNRKGTHPDLGTVSLRQLVNAWAVHDLDHLSQIMAVLATPFREHVGPWAQYLPIVGVEEH